MAAVSYFSVNSIMRNQIIESAKDTLKLAESNIKVSLRESETTISNASLSIKRIIEGGGTQGEVRNFFNDTADWLLADTDRWLVFRGIYGIVRDEFIDGTRWSRPLGYDFSAQPWFISARHAKGRIAITMPYSDTRGTNTGNSSKMIVSISQEVYGTGRRYIGVVAIDMYLERFFRDVASLSLVDGGYGMIVNNRLDIIAHNDARLINAHMAGVSKGFEELAEALASGQEISGKVIADKDGVRWIAFFKKIYNGWYVGMLAPTDKFYGPARHAAVRLSVLGALLCILLSAILLRLSARKMRSDEENRSKTHFLASMSHEIRTPMNAIIGMSELALRAEDKDTVNDYLSGIRQSGQNLLSIINDILDVAKIESGKTDIECAPYSLSKLLNEVLNVTRIRLVDRPILFTTYADCDIPDTLMGDETRIHQILTNILSNAAKYTNAGHISLSVSAMRSDEYIIHLNFEVADTGIGIKEQDLKGLFRQFVRLDMERNRHIEGTGLGLAITYNLVQAMGGEINISSVYGSGSVFIVTIPQTTVKDEKKLASVRDAASKRVVLYDDRQICGESVVLTLQNLGVPVTVIGSTEKFLAELSTGAYQFAFVSPSAVDDAVSFQKRMNLDTKIVLLSGIGEQSPYRDIAVIGMPAYGPTVAGVLNGVSESGHKSAQEVRHVFPSSKALVVDDNLTNLKVAHGLLSAYKLQIDICENGPDALKFAGKTRYDLIFMDHMMPGMDGIEVTSRLRDMEGYAETPIIALTANAVSGMSEIFLQNGMNDFLSKPIDSARLYELLSKWLPGSKEQLSGREIEKAAFARHVEGIDMERALEVLEGNRELLCQVIRTYIKHTSALLDKIVSPSAENLGEYAIIVHGIKGSSMSLQAGDVASRAAELENASKSGDISTVIMKNGDFIRITRRLISDLGVFLAEESQDADRDIKISPDRKLLDNIIEASERFDASAIEQNLSEMEKYTYENGGDLVKWIREQYENLEYDLIRERLTSARDSTMGPY
jgi:signal transduction histidine kinase/FixJ family two-component response regulator